MRKEVARQDDEIGKIAGAEHALAMLGELGIRGPARVALDRLRQRDAFFRKPTVGRHAVRELARDGGIEAEHRIERRHEPVGPKRHAHARVEERADVVGDARSVARPIRASAQRMSSMQWLGWMEATTPSA